MIDAKRSTVTALIKLARVPVPAIAANAPRLAVQSSGSAGTLHQPVADKLYASGRKAIINAGCRSDIRSIHVGIVYGTDGVRVEIAVAAPGSLLGPIEPDL
jgi:hypothetical protein